MSGIETWLATSPWGSAVKVFLGFLLGAALLTWTQEGVISFDHWQTWVIGALGIAVPVVINLLNPADPRYGRGSA
jgi:hypothetical protein